MPAVDTLPSADHRRNGQRAGHGQVAGRPAGNGPAARRPGRGLDADQDAGSTGQDAPRAVPIAEAARRLGIPIEAARKRAQRGSLQGFKDPDGRWLIVLPVPDAGRDASGTPGLPVQPDTPPDNGQVGMPIVRDAGQDRLIASLEDQVRFLREELERRDEEIRRRDEQVIAAQHALAALSAKIPSLPAPRPDVEQDDGQDVSDPPPVRRPWWRVW